MRSPSPPPLRTVRAPFDAYGSSIEQRPCGIRPGAAPPAHDTPYGTRSPHWPWGQPGHYYGRAGYRNSAGAAPRALPSVTDLLCPPSRLAVGSCPPTPEGSRLAFAGSCNPYPTYYGPAFASSPVLYPPPHRLTLRLAYPRGRTTGLPRCIAGILVGYTPRGTE